MTRSDTNLSETDIWPTHGECRIVSARPGDTRRWFKQAAICPALEHYRIRHTAVATLSAPFRIVRTQLSGSYFLACLQGAGKVLVDGRWLRCRAGQAALLPPRTRQAFHAVPGKPWKICWVRYEELPQQRPLASSQSPVIAQFQGEPLAHAITGLYEETHTGVSAPVWSQWIDLIQHYVTQFAEPAKMDVRLWRLWEQVARALAESWTIARMSQATHLGEKQLQRLCQQHLGRTPRQQLIWLRMRKAAELLSESKLKINTVAQRVGYENPFVFSTIFKRVMGWSPSAYPGRKGK